MDARQVTWGAVRSGPALIFLMTFGSAAFDILLSALTFVLDAPSPAVATDKARESVCRRWVNRAIMGLKELARGDFSGALLAPGADASSGALLSASRLLSARPPPSS